MRDSGGQDKGIGEAGRRLFQMIFGCGYPRPPGTEDVVCDADLDEPDCDEEDFL